jgi:hypothetical protein
MPVVFSNPQFPLQAGPNGVQSYVQQLSFRQMIEQAISPLGNPDLDREWAARTINEVYREVIGRRAWYALKTMGVINIPNTINGGQAAVTQGSNIVQGIGTNWTTALIGQQFRVGFTYPYQTIFNVNEALQQLTVSVPFGGATTVGGYNIIEAYVTLGANAIKLAWAVNQQQGWDMNVDLPVEWINKKDVWRQSLGWSTLLAARAPTPDGQYQLEVWPTPYQQQVFPWEGYIQPPDMANDDDSPASFIRADLIMSKVIAEAKVAIRSSKHYDAYASKRKDDEFNRKMETMENSDNQMDQRDVTWNYGEETGEVGFGPGATWAQSHDA